MKRILLVLAVLAIGALLFHWLAPDEPAPERDLPQAFARAKAYYLNETSADYRRARMELEAFATRLDRSAPFHLDMALIDLQEINYRVQDESRLLSEPDVRRLLRSAMTHLQAGLELDPDNPSIHYNLARTCVKLAPSAENADELLERAGKLLEPLTRLDPPDPSTLLQFGDLRRRARDFKGAGAAYSAIVELGKDYVPRTMFYVALNRLERIEYRLNPARAKELRKRIDEEYPEKPKATAGALERGRYTAFLELGDIPAADSLHTDLKWEKDSGRAGVPAVGTPRFFIAPDIDDDCARDLVVNTPAGMRVLRNRRNASFDDLTKQAGLPMDFVIAAAAVGDFDGDGRCDLVAGGPEGLRLFLNVTDEETSLDWSFAEVSQLPDGTPLFGAAGKAPVTAITLWDLDHDGDLDVFAGGTPNRVYILAIEQPIEGGRYLRFEEAAGRLGLQEPPAHDALILDVEDDQDVDLLLTGPSGNAWFENLRELRFQQRPMPEGFGLEAADVDNDLREEVRVGDKVYKWDGERWRIHSEHLALLDLDCDGVIDTQPQPGLKLGGKPVRAIAADLNRDGSRDLLVLTDEGLALHMSVPGAARAWIDVRPRGLKSNEWGIGTRVQLFAGDLRIAATCRDGLLSFGLGREAIVDAVTIRWTNGVEQGEVTPRLASCEAVEEREGEVGSCPFLYTFDGERWRFIADCHSGTPLGLPVATGVYLPPRPNETIFVPGRALKAVDGKLRLDLAEEFRELFYVDQVVLRAIDHPPATRPVLNEGFRVMTFPEFRVHGLDDLTPPRSARDHKGRDITGLVRAKDGRHAVVWDKLDSRYVGLAKEWAIELDFGDLTDAKRVLLVMDGWVEFPTASASIAASQSKTVNFQPPILDVVGPDGEWVVADRDPGFPAGKGKAVLVDLTGKIPTRDGRVRIRSTQRLHWDAFAISVGPDRPIRLTEAPLVGAVHKYRGVGRRIEDPAGEQPWRYSHDELLEFVPYDQMPMGMVSRYGDVRELLGSIDDRYPILASGDVVELVFDASGLPPLPDGWTRDYCFTTEGWVKDADMNQAIRERVGPLPFHAMSSYPYDEAKEAHPHPDFVQEWLTRPTRRLVDPAALR